MKIFVSNFLFITIFILDPTCAPKNIPMIIGETIKTLIKPLLKKINIPTNEVTPIIKLLVAIATFIGTFIILFIIGTKIAPPPTPNSPAKIPPTELNIIPSFFLSSEYFTIFFVLSSKYSLFSPEFNSLLILFSFIVLVFLYISIATYPNTIPKIILRILLSINNAVYAPMIDPIAAPISRIELNLMSVMPFFIYTKDELLEFTNTPMKLSPIASCIGISNNIVNAGTSIIPPPSPNNDPIIPAMKLVDRIYTKNSISTRIIAQSC